MNNDNRWNGDHNCRRTISFSLTLAVNFGVESGSPSGDGASWPDMAGTG